MSSRSYTRRASIQSNKSDEIDFIKNLTELCRQESKESIKLTRKNSASRQSSKTRLPASKPSSKTSQNSKNKVSFQKSCVSLPNSNKNRISILESNTVINTNSDGQMINTRVSQGSQKLRDSQGSQKPNVKPKVEVKSRESEKSGMFFNQLSNLARNSSLNSGSASKSRRASTMTDRSIDNSFISRYTTSSERQTRTSVFQAVEIRKSTIQKLGSLDNILDSNSQVLIDNVMGGVDLKK